MSENEPNMLVEDVMVLIFKPEERGWSFGTITTDQVISLVKQYSSAATEYDGGVDFRYIGTNHRCVMKFADRWGGFEMFETFRYDEEPETAH